MKALAHFLLNLIARTRNGENTAENIFLFSVTGLFHI